jgi:hypothetical protein
MRTQGKPEFGREDVVWGVAFTSGALEFKAFRLFYSPTPIPLFRI